MSDRTVSVLFDHQCFWEKFGGVSRYFTEILKTNNEYANYQLALKYSNNEYLKELDFAYKPFLSNVQIPKKHYLISAVNKPNSIKTIKHSDASIVHLTHYDPYLFKYLKGKVVISTIHDLNFFATPQFFGKQTKLLKNWQTQCINKSDKLITISENSKKDLVNFFNIPEEKISIIYHGISDVFSKSSERNILPYPYILFVGRRNGYKNFSIVEKVFSMITDKYPDIRLVCTGLPFSDNEKKHFANLKINSKVIHFSATERDLVNLYSNALFFVFPSFYEGFGFPLLEAMACECPVLCSNASCFPEIASNAASYFDPNSVEELCEKMIEIIENERLRTNLIKNGLKRKKDFSWEESRIKHFELYKSLI